MKNNHEKNKRGVSEMIGYVLLIVGAIVMAGLVYGWMRSYVPRETVECPDGVSVFIKEASCTLENSKYILNLSLENRGRFNVEGYFIKATDNVSQTIATVDISSNLSSGANANAGMVIFAATLEPGKDARTAIYDLTEQIYSIEILPLMYEVIDGKNKLVTCGNAKVKEKVSCS